MAVLQIADVRAELGLGDSIADADIAGKVAQAQAAISTRCGPLEPTTFVEVRMACRGRLVVSHAREVTVQSLTNIYWGPIDPAGVQVLPGGVLWRPYGYIPDGPWTITYTAGWSTLPDDLARAVMELTRHLWQTRRGTTFRPQGEPEPGAAHAWPYRVEELVDPWREQAGLA